jgi:hypothetical protein
LFVDGGLSDIYVSPDFPFALCRRFGSQLGELIMPIDSLSEDIAGLLGVLEEFERSIGKRPISTHRQPAKLHDEAESKMAYLTSAVDRSENRFVERIATAMSKLRVQAV